MIPVEQALRTVLENVEPLGAEPVELGESCGRVLAQDVLSDLDMPPFDRVMMDGYAVRAADTAAAPARLAVAGQVRAGQQRRPGVGPGEAVEVMTGAPLPEGADAVQQVERTRREGEAVHVLAPVEPGQNVAPRAAEVRAGQRVLEAGIAIDPAVVAVLASFGCARPLVGLRPSLALLATGDELVDAGDRPVGAQIRNSNSYALAAQAKAAGARLVPLGVAPDDAERIAAALAPGLGSDVLVVSGGVSAGAFDLVEPVLARLGARFLFTQVALKPGAPLVFGRLGRTLVFGLPGNPVSAQVTFELFARPALLRLQGASVPLRPRVEAELLLPARNRSRRLAHLPARIRFEGGRFAARPLPSRGSADVVAHAGANALLVLPAEREEAAAGERVEAVLLGSFLERDGAG